MSPGSPTGQTGVTTRFSRKFRGLRRLTLLHRPQLYTSFPSVLDAFWTRFSESGSPRFCEGHLEALIEERWIRILWAKAIP